jgi:hypothetical protein
MDGTRGDLGALDSHKYKPFRLAALHPRAFTGIGIGLFSVAAMATVWCAPRVRPNPDLEDVRQEPENPQRLLNAGSQRIVLDGERISPYGNDRFPNFATETVTKVNDKALRSTPGTYY